LISFFAGIADTGDATLETRCGVGGVEVWAIHHHMLQLAYAKRIEIFGSDFLTTPYNFWNQSQIYVLNGSF